MRALRLLCLAAVLLAATPLHAHAQADWLRVLAADGLALAGSPAHWDQRGWGQAGLTAGGAMALYQMDGRIRDSLQHRRGGVGDAFADLGNPFGDPLILVPGLAITALWGHHSGDGYLKVTGLKGAEALLFAGMSTALVKAAGGRARPEAGLGPYDWSGPRSGPDTRLSFPSGHTSSAFAVATVIARRHPAIRIPAYGIAALTGFARLERDQHWASDVWTGAALGIWVGRTLTGPETSSRVRIEPMLLPGGAGIQLSMAR